MGIKISVAPQLKYLVVIGSEFGLLIFLLSLSGGGFLFLLLSLALILLTSYAIAVKILKFTIRQFAISQLIFILFIPLMYIIGSMMFFYAIGVIFSGF
jgi:hypothetical protein